MKDITMPSKKDRSDTVIGIELSMIEFVIGATAITSATSLFFGWLYHHAYFDVFNMKPEWLGYSLQDYILGSRNVFILGTLIIFALFMAKLRFDFGRADLRLLLFWISIIGFIGLIAYLIYDVAHFLSTRGLTAVTYRPLWITIFSLSIFFAYSISASTLFYKYLNDSNKYRAWGPYAVWSGYAALAFMGLAFLATVMGYLEGTYDASETSTRLARVNVITRTELGFEIKPDRVSNDNTGTEIYTYYNLRLLAQKDDTLYVFRIGSPVYMLQKSNLYSLMLGETDISDLQPINSITPTPVP
jgi:hypothetical protein